jgi:hypothetical protein
LTFGYLCVILVSSRRAMPYYYFGGYLMNTYTIYLGACPIACVDAEGAYPCFEAAKTLAEYTGKEASLVWDENGEEIAFFDPENPDECGEPDWDGCDDDCGFDPYMGCYTDDC